MNPPKVNTLKLNDPSYPESLRHINKPPNTLYFIGRPPTDWLDKPKVAIVGSRKASNYGKSVTEDIAGKLARAGVVIISGLAYGIDAAAHQAAVFAGGTAVVVLATPVTKIYPAGHRQLADKIIENGGTILSECDENSQVYKASFLQRNRIISGLSDVVLITEAALRSGSLNTARTGLEQGKTVMAVPGNVTSYSSAGSNNLIKAGALLVTDVEDVFFALGMSSKDQLTPVNYRGSEEEEKILKLIRSGVTSQEELATASKLDGQAINNALTMLEIAGAIRPSGGGNWVVA